MLLLKSDIVKLNDDELVAIAMLHNKQELDEKSMATWFAGEYNSEMICVTNGEKGALLYSAGKFYEHPGFKVNAVDTV